MTNDKFHELCDKQGPLLVIIKTSKDILVGGFCTSSYKNEGSWSSCNSDPNAVVFSITRNKVYLNLNETENVFFHTDSSFHICGDAI